MKYIFTVYTTDGKEWESEAQEADEKLLDKITLLVSDLKDLKHFAMPTTDALGRETKIYFHPEKIVAVRITKETL